MKLKVWTCRQEIVEPELRKDLRLALGERGLVDLTLESVQTVSTDALRSCPIRPRALRPQMMLTLLTYCYAAGIYGSEDVEYATRTNPMVRYICARTYPGWACIRRFRRENRALIEHCLTRVLKQAWESKHPEIVDSYCFASVCQTRLEKQILNEARSRLDIAITLDMVIAD